MASGFAYDLVILFWRIVINIFFREIRPRGAFNIPREGPVLFICAPHSNQFLDPLLLFSEVRKEAHRRVSVIAAAKSMERAFIGLVGRVLNSIPVARAADYAKAGSGRITISESAPLVVIGTGTKFKKEIMERGQLVLPKSASYASAPVEEVISDTELRLKSEFTVPSKDGNTNVKATVRVKTEMEAKGGLEYKILPHVEQEQTYGAVFQRLNEGGCIGIFPEGGSHDRTDFLPLKAGFSIMALGAMAAKKDLDVKLVPVGLSYFHAHKFRSRAVIEFGPPISVDRSLVTMYEEGGVKKREACGRLLETVHEGLRAVTLRAPDWDTMQVVQAARRLYRIPGQHLTLGQVNELNKRFMEGYLHYQHEPRIIEIRKRVVAYNRLLRDMGIADHQVERASNRSVKSLLLLVYRTGLLLWWGMLALPGVILHAPVFILAKVISHQKAKEALAASTVKIQGRDVLATWKVLVSLAVVPILYVVYTVLATIAAYRYDLFPEWSGLIPIAIFVSGPALGYSALKFGEAGMDVAKSLRPLFLSLWPGNQREVNRLREMREQLANDISDIIGELPMTQTASKKLTSDEFGPQLYENFDKARILPSATAPQTGRSSRKTHAVESSVLSHPIDWLDNRIFGWSRSGSVGQVWGGTASERARLLEPDTAPVSPAESEDDEEADVDYDDILSVVDTRRANGPGSPRKRTGRSYADLQLERTASASQLPAHARERTRSQSSQPPRSPSARGDVPLPRADDDGAAVVQLRKRERTGEGRAGQAGDDGASAEGAGRRKAD